MSGNDSGLTSGDQMTLEQELAERIIAENEANAASTFDANEGKTKSNFDFFPKNINPDKQGKHIPGHNNFQPGKSELTISMSEANSLVKTFSEHGTAIGSNKERVDFGRIIGYYVDPETHKKLRTSIGIIHYSKSGTHIVPARPKEE